MKFFKKNQIIIYVIALMLVTAGYLSYTSNVQELTANAGVETAEARNIGDAQLVSSQITENEINNTVNNIEDTNLTNNNQLANETTDNTIQNIANTTNNDKQEEQQDYSDTNSNTNNIGNTIQTNASTSSSEYFTTSKLERDTMYSQMIETYEKVLNSSNALETQKQTATDEITKINNTKNSIMICENLIGTKGFTNNVIFVNGDSITVIIGATELQAEEVAQIQNIIAREMNASIENIHIAIK